MKVINPDDIPRVALIVIAIINSHGDQKLKRSVLIDKIHESLNEAFPGESVGNFHGLDFLLNQVTDESLGFFHLLFVPNHNDLSMPCQALLFATTGITISSKVYEYFEGGVPSQSVRALIKPAVVMMHKGRPPSCLVKGTIISGEWGSLASFEKDGSDSESVQII